MSYSILKNKSVLITGGTGSFGQSCVKFLLENTEARRVIVFSRDELKQYQMQNRLSDPDRRLRFFIGDIRDLDRLKRAFDGVDYVLHAAALKQVPALEYNPYEAVKTNIIGTQNVIDASIDQKVERVMLISTDKAASPVSLYGATKLCAEKLFISGNAYSGDRTKFGVVRYGNVLGSRGSLVELIREQASTGQVTLTHEDMTRFWIRLEDGINLVLMALEKMHGGEIFIPKIPSMKVKDFINILAPNCEFKVIGIRPGEKLHEVLVTSEEARHTKEYDDYYLILPEYDWWPHKDAYKDVDHVVEGFEFVSHKNQSWLDGDGLKKLVDLL